MSNNIPIDNFCQLLSKFSKTYTSENNEKIHKQYQKIKKIINSQPSLQFNSILNKEFSQYKEECEVISIQTSYLFKDNWATVINKDDLLIQTNKTINQFLIKLQFSVYSDILRVTSVFYESDLIGDWMKAIKFSRTLEKISMYRKKIQNFYNLPWPLNDRHSILNVRFYPMPNLDSVLITSYTPTEHIENQVVEEGYIEMVLPSASLWIKSNGDSCVVILIFQANKYINSMPDWIVNFIIKSYFCDIVKDFKSIIQNFKGTKYHEAMETTNRHLYESLSKLFNIRTD